MQLTAHKEWNRCCCTTCFSIPSSGSVGFLGRPDMAFLARLPVSMNLRQTLETVLRLMFICKATRLTATAACRMLISVRLCSAVISLPRPIIIFYGTSSSNVIICTRHNKIMVFLSASLCNYFHISVERFCMVILVKMYDETKLLVGMCR